MTLQVSNLTKVKPLAEWNSETNEHYLLIWWIKLENYLIEVRRKAPYGLILCIFDHNDDDKFIHSEDVIITSDDEVTPTEGDIFRWRLKAANFIDNIFGKQAS